MFEAFQIGPLFIWTRLVFVLVGVWLFAEFFLRLAQSANLSLQHFQEHGLWYVIAFILGERLIAVVAEYQVYLKDPARIPILWDGGFSFLGGAIGIGIVLWFATREHRAIFLHWLDALVPATTLGLVFSWLGSFFSGQAYGRPTDAFWGITYDAMNVRYAVPIHPVQLYEAVFYFFLTFLLLIIRKKAKRVGSETLVGIVCASVATFLFESFRGDFSIPVFATQLDFFILMLLFLSLGLMFVVELKLTERGFLLYQAALGISVTGYLFLRPWLDLETFELRISQLLSLLALLVTIVYVVVERRRYPHL
ncbi:prolipoprotein diacylglyceryl transferase [Candidatus Peregrinibacteria bacterium]|nr:prolipoprotein diacylglyceryl transferase [Candidatus Peregrinibacteria bacterium]MBI3816909.1 prolipoprotein diacylglyceryl transferase [Candidatus Peregrinibacteria bacterium]